MMNVLGSRYAVVIVMAAAFLISPVLAQTVGQPSNTSPPILVDNAARQAADIVLPFRPNAAHCDGQYRWLNSPMQVGALVGGWIKDVRVIRYRSREGHLKETEIRDQVRKVWQGTFQSASCYIPWAEGNIWTVEAVVEFYDGKQTTFVTDGSHVELQDYGGQYWYMRALPAVQ
jgi:hypothetical protein